MTPLIRINVFRDDYLIAAIAKCHTMKVTEDGRNFFQRHIGQLGIRPAVALSVVMSSLGVTRQGKNECASVGLSKTSHGIALRHLM